MERVEKICKSDIYGLILREKALTPEEYRKLAEKVKPVCEKYGVRLILHGHYEVAKTMRHPYLHLPLPQLAALPEKKRKRFWMLGASCHSVEEALLAQSLGATYITFSPVYETTCKQGATPKGVEALKQAVDALEIPVLALGGITPENVGEVLACGAEGVCVRSGFMLAEDVAGYTLALRGQDCERKIP